MEEGEVQVSNGALQASQGMHGGWRQDWMALVLQVLEEGEEGPLRDREVVVVDLAYIQVEEVEVVVHL